VTPVEIVLLLIVVLGMAGLAYRHYGLTREVRAEIARLETRVEQLAWRPQVALDTLMPTVTPPMPMPTPKPHRHQWLFASEEATNGKHVKFHTCAVGGCADVYREEASSGHHAL
jgi:hypothetical protein